MELPALSASIPTPHVVEPSRSTGLRAPAQAPVTDSDRREPGEPSGGARVVQDPRLAAPGVCRGTAREAAARSAPFHLSDVVAQARRDGVVVSPAVLSVINNELLPTYNNDYRSCDVPMYCYDFAKGLRDRLRAQHPQAKVDMLELLPKEEGNVHHFVVRADLGQGPIIFDLTADQFELLAGRARVGPQVTSEGAFVRRMSAFGYGSPSVAE